MEQYLVLQELATWVSTCVAGSAFDVCNTINMYYGIQGRGHINVLVLKDAYGKFGHFEGEKQICDYLSGGRYLLEDRGGRAWDIRSR